MKKLDYMALTEAFNKFRMEHQSRTYSREEILAELKKLGISPTIGNSLLARGFVPSERIGKAKLYSFGSTPVHKSQIESLYEDKNKKVRVRKEKFQKEHKLLTNEEQALQLLQERGYQVRKVVGFDLERFQRENPVLYKKYLKYEIVWGNEEWIIAHQICFECNFWNKFPNNARFENNLKWTDINGIKYLIKG